jgi:enoyl-CoA hydratase
MTVVQYTGPAEIGGHVARLTLDSPHNRNALSSALVAQLREGLRRATADIEVRAGGMGLVGACDIVIAGPRSTFALTEARIGVAPALISLTLLPKLDPRAAARYYLTGETFNSRRAAKIGLVTSTADDVGFAVDAVTAELSKASPQGLAASKALTTAAVLAGFDRDADRLAEESARLFVSEEAREGMLAFLQKRPPRWAADG